MLERLLTEEGRRKAAWILRKVGYEVDVEPEEPEIEGEELSDYELTVFDEIEMLVYADEYDAAHRLAMRVIGELIEKGRYRSALYVCQMIGDEIMRREILKRGILHYERKGDFRNAMEFAIKLGDTERAKIYETLNELSRRIREP